MAPRRTDDERTSSVSSGGTVLELSFNVGEMIRRMTKMEEKQDRAEEKNDRQHEDTRAAFTREVSALRAEIKSDYATKFALDAGLKDANTSIEAVRKTADGVSGGVTKVAWIIIGIVITAVVTAVVAAPRLAGQ